MDEAEHRERATSFGTIAELYDRFRPAPPVEVAEWLVPEGSRRVADLGAGTGGFSRVLSGLVGEVVAVELDHRMAAIAARSPRVSVVNARAEDLPLASGSLDAVVVSSAWHWMDPDRTLPEIARVLRPGGSFGVVWNGPARSVEWVAELLGGPRNRQRSGEWRRLQVPDGLGFGLPEQRTFEYTLPRTPSELVGLAGTYSRLAILPEPDRLAARRRVTELVERHPVTRGQGTIDLPMGARCWRATRSAAAA